MVKKMIHIAIVPDGNRRWAKKHKKLIWFGHKKGARKLEDVLEWCNDYPEIKIISIYALSTENLTRPKGELKKLWDLYKKEFEGLRETDDVKEKRMKVNIMGDSKYWRPDVRQVAKELMNTTKTYTNRVLNILLAYGGKYEIIKAAQEIVKKGVKKVPSAERIFNKMLMVNEPVDLIIRTGGEHRISNMLLYQAAYAEIYFSDTLWPDFSKKEFKKIMAWYKRRQRKFGR